MLDESKVANGREWFIVGRWQEYEGEAGANLIRILAISVFYAVELINYHGLRLGFLQFPRVLAVDRRFHSVVTALAVAWVTIAGCVHIALRRRIFPERLKYLSSAADVVMLTFILSVCGGPRSPLIVCYFPLVVLSALRFSLPLIRFSTGGSVAGYLFLLGYARWFNPALRVPRYFEIIFILALTLCGTVSGQVIRRARRLAEEYSVGEARARGAAGGA